MKTKAIYLTMVIAIMSLTTVFGQAKTEKFKVYGNCGMCESRIEKAAKLVDGVTAADWNKETKMIEVSFDSSKTDVHKVHMAIAKAGHDTDMHKAKDETYNSLPGCCKYERAEKKRKTIASISIKETLKQKKLPTELNQSEVYCFVPKAGLEPARP
ncbi:heavy-metal-associated domain-containing protein [Plebeiibacterium marinum]|uniref:Heavy-metal-associated domain-containing protein n=1 Tax=Plebeiibacterium marinum TaxID=2992111 RepID=A0AAE3MER4_9BACT|nr:heavy-metal-associated domain-containing protein [Plebeiobacterium marinum]MCW3805712.1 heavy-metal-associated domain-containing protein [Plebeiobacterium marinum]